MQSATTALSSVITLSRRLYYDMLRIRLIEEAIAERYADQEMRCPVHLSIGQEAISVGVCSALRLDDKIVSNHRAHAHYLAKGGDLRQMLAEFYGKAAGCCGGRGGSMHIFDDAAGVLLSLPIVASSIPIGVGAALGLRQGSSDQVVAVFFGDGAIEEGVWHESANFAALRKLPVIFVCENNLFSVYTRIDDRQPKRPLTDLAIAHGIPSAHGDGNNALDVYRMSAEAVARARRGDGPSFLLFDTYRWREHCGPNYDNDIGYRTETEFLDWKKRCPVATFRRRLITNGTLSTSEDASMTRQIESEIDAAIAFAKAAPFPTSTTAGSGIYA